MRTLILFTLLASCASQVKKIEKATTLSTPADAQKIFIHGDKRIGTYISSPRGFSTSSYWIEGPTGLILIDTQFLLSAGEEAVRWAEESTGKKVVLAIILHPNPDKFNGTANLQKRGIKVVTSEQVLKLIPEVHKDRHHWFYDRYKPDYPNETPKPESFGRKTQNISAGGLTVKVHVLGAGCSEAHVVVQFEKHLFVGDLIANQGHAWIELGKIDDWLKRLEEMDELDINTVHPGRGPSGNALLISRQVIYLEDLIDLVKKENPRAGLKDEEKDKIFERIKEQMEESYPGYSQPFFLDVGLPTVWESLAKRPR